MEANTAFSLLGTAVVMKMFAMLALIYPFLALAIVGSVATLAIHVASLFGFTYPFEHFLKFLGPAVFIVFLPTIFVMNQLTREFKQKDIWRAALRGCPP